MTAFEPHRQSRKVAISELSHSSVRSGSSPGMERTEIPPQFPWLSILLSQPWIWLFLALLYFTIDQGRQPIPDFAQLAIRSATWALSGAFITSLLLMLYREGQMERLAPKYLGVPVIVGIILGAFLWLAFFNFLDGVLELEPGFIPIYQWPREVFFHEMMDHFMCITAWHGWALTHLMFRKSLHNQERALKAEAAIEKSKNAELRARLNPHFLFNSLNSIAALIGEDPNKAEDMVVQLSELLRESLRRDSQEIVALTEELSLVEQYVQIEKTRFEEKLQFNIEIEPQLTQLSVPRFCLQPLVENSIKHGMRSSPMPLQVGIKARRGENGISISVWNSGTLNPQKPSHLSQQDCGQGLRIIQEQFKLHFGASHFFRLYQEAENVVAELILLKPGLSNEAYQNSIS